MNLDERRFVVMSDGFGEIARFDPATIGKSPENLCDLLRMSVVTQDLPGLGGTTIKVPTVEIVEGMKIIKDKDVEVEMEDD